MGFKDRREQANDGTRSQGDDDRGRGAEGTATSGPQMPPPPPPTTTAPPPPPVAGMPPQESPRTTGGDAGRKSALGTLIEKGPDGRPLYQKRRFLLPVVAVLAFAVGMSVGAGDAGTAREEARAALAAKRDAEQAAADAAERADQAEAQVAEAEAAAAEAREEADFAVDVARAQVEEEMADRIADVESQLAGRIAELDAREAAVSQSEEIAARSTMTSGRFMVGTDIEPGTWRAPGGGSCYWARLSGLGGDLGDIIANHLGDGQQVVSIAVSDVAFETSGCGEWTRMP